MAKWTKEKRDALPIHDFGQPEDREFPIEDQEDVDDAARLIGKAKDPERTKHRIIAICHRKGLTVPSAWQAKEATMSDEMVVRRGPIFRADDYPDKKLTVTEADLDAAVAAFTEPVDAELEHVYTQGVRTFLDGKIGKLQKVWREGKILHGEMTVPPWIDQQWADAGRKVSVVIDPASKALKRIGMVLTPRVSEAALFSAYATFAAKRHDTWEGQGTIQQVHDMCSRAGAVCVPPDGVGFVSQHEADAVQKMHDQAVEHGAKCHAKPAPNDSFDSYFSQDTVTGALAEPSSKRKKMAGFSKGSFTDLKDKIRSWYDKGEEARNLAREAGAELPDEEFFSIVDDQARNAAREAAREAQERELAAIKADRDAAQRDRDAARQEALQARSMRVQAEATGYVDGLIAGNKVLPAEREILIAQFSQAAMDDAENAQVAFSTEKGKSRVEMFKASCEARVPHTLTKEMLAGTSGTQVLFNQTTTPNGQEKPPTQEELDELLGLAGFDKLVAKHKEGK